MTFLLFIESFSGRRGSLVETVARQSGIEDYLYSHLGATFLANRRLSVQILLPAPWIVEDNLLGGVAMFDESLTPRTVFVVCPSLPDACNLVHK